MDSGTFLMTQTGPRSSGRVEESKEGADYTAAGRRGDRPNRTACSPAVKPAEEQRGPGRRARLARPAVQPQAGREGQAEGAGNTRPGCLPRLRPHAGSGIPGQQTRHSCRTRNGAHVDDGRQAMAGQPAARRKDPRMAATPLADRRDGAVGHQRSCPGWRNAGRGYI